MSLIPASVPIDADIETIEDEVDRVGERGCRRAREEQTDRAPIGQKQPFACGTFESELTAQLLHHLLRRPSAPNFRNDFLNLLKKRFIVIVRAIAYLRKLLKCNPVCCRTMRIPL